MVLRTDVILRSARAENAVQANILRDACSCCDAMIRCTQNGWRLTAEAESRHRSKDMGDLCT